METITNIEVKPSDIDVLGHVNNSVYVSYLEKGRTDWYEKAGFTFNENQTIGTVIIRLDILYLKEVRLGDSLKVITIPIRLGNKSYVMKQNIFNQRDEHVSEATVTSVMFDTVTRKSVKVTNEIARCFEGFQE
ncbi:acyl-CoA thioesterase [Alkalihalobacterium alkalinitrilicum]|uniref:acyl-CoA thioesterase n=1 Tax=Alkalihalobacterium alkalinitrilicum TaxID=427920 RepID=UPI000994CD1B|nr:thioesterase family protein [Alkalihalobacterium alkalinitrilicum]